MTTITTRAAKGAELTHAEVDANFTNLAAAINFLLPVDAAFSTTIPLTGNTFMPQQSVASALAFSPAVSPVKDAKCYVRLIADGTHAPTFSGVLEWGGSAGYDNRAGIVNEIEFWYDGVDCWYSISQAVGAISAATVVTLTGPTSGLNGVASTAFTVGVNGGISSTITVTPSDSSGGGTFTPTSVSLTSASPSATFTYTPASTGAKTISVTNSGSLTNPTSITYTVSAAATAPGQVTGLTLGTATSTTQPLTWTAPSDGGSAITDYVVQWSPAGANTWTTFADGTSATASATVTGLTASTSYDYRVAAVNAVGTGSYSSTATGSTAAAASALRFGQLSNVTESGSSQNYVYTATSGAGIASYQGEGILNQTFGTGDAEIIVRVPTKPNEMVFGLTTSSTPVSYPGVAYGVWLSGSGDYSQITGGSPGSGSPGGTWAANDLIRIARVGTTITVARQPSGNGTWTTTHTWTGVPATAFNIALCLNDGCVVDTISGTGLV